MNKTLKIVLIVLAVIIVAIVAVCIVKSSNKDKELENNQKITIGSVEDLENLVNKCYEGINQDLLQSLTTTIIDPTQRDIVKMQTGLANGDELEYLVVSQPLTNTKAYEFAIAKVKSGVDANAVAKKMSEQIDMSKWIDVEAEKLYATNSGDIVCLIMGDAEVSKTVYDNFKKQVGKVGEEYEKIAEETENA